MQVKNTYAMIFSLLGGNHCLLLHTYTHTQFWLNTGNPPYKQIKYNLEAKPLIAQSCGTICRPMEYSPLGSSVYGISQARILEYTAISFSRDLSDPGSNLGLVHHLPWQEDSLPLRLQGSPWSLPKSPNLKELSLLCFVLRYIDCFLLNDGSTYRFFTLELWESDKHSVEIVLHVMLFAPCPG